MSQNAHPNWPEAGPAAAVPEAVMVVAVEAIMHAVLPPDAYDPRVPGRSPHLGSPMSRSPTATVKALTKKVGQIHHGA